MAQYKLTLSALKTSEDGRSRVASKSTFHSPLQGAVQAIVTIPQRIAAEIERRLGPDGEIVCEAVITGKLGNTVGLRILA